MAVEKKIVTLCFLCRDGQVLLGMKKRGFGAGRWNGFGGKVEGEEDLESATRREVQEEVGLIVGNIEKQGLITFNFTDGSRTMEVHIYRSEDFTGEVAESEEMQPEWFSVDALPLSDMWPADVHWLPWFFAGKKFVGTFLYDHPTGSNTVTQVLEKNLIEVSLVP